MPQIGSLFVQLGMNTGQFTQASTAAAKSLDVVADSSKKTQHALMGLGFQLNDVATGFALGQRPMQIFAQQAGQIFQVFAQGGGFKAVMTGAGQAIRNFITPMRAAALGVGTVVAGIAILVNRAMDAQSRMRGFDVMLRGMGTQGQATAAGLEAAAKRLRDVGLSADEAKDAMLAAQRAGIAPGQSERIVRIGQNLIPVLGEGAPGALNSAIEGGVESLGKMVRQLGLVSAAEIEAAREAEKYGQQVQYLNRWVTLLEQHSSGLRQRAMSPLGKAFEQLRITFASLLDAMANSRVITTLVDILNSLAQTLEYIFRLEPPPWFSKWMGWTPSGGGTPTTTTRFRTGRKGHACRASSRSDRSARKRKPSADRLGRDGLIRLSPDRDRLPELAGEDGAERDINRGGSVWDHPQYLGPDRQELRYHGFLASQPTHGCVRTLSDARLPALGTEQRETGGGARCWRRCVGSPRRPA